MNIDNSFELCVTGNICQCVSVLRDDFNFTLEGNLDAPDMVASGSHFSFNWPDDIKSICSPVGVSATLREAYNCKSYY